jgi:hypothetical protein
MRRGHTIIEALCALTLGGLLASASGLALGAARGALTRAEARDIGGRAEREAVAIVRRALENGEAVLARGDTAIELDVLLGVGVACAVGTREVWLSWPQSDGLTALPTLPTPDDLVAVRDWTAGAEAWAYAVVESAAARVDALICAAADGWRDPAAASQPLLRVMVAESLPSALGPGAEVRFYRRGRYALYHAGRSEWMLGWRRCHPWSGACGTVQPVAGPLRAPSVEGFRVRVASAPDRWEILAFGVGGRGASASVPR